MTEDTRTSHNDQQSWVVLTFLFALANFLEVAVVAHFILFTPTFLSVVLGFTNAEVEAWTGPLASIAFLFGIWLVPFWGVLADRYGRKPLVLRSYYVEVIAMALAAMSQNIWLYLLARSLTGLALGNTGLMYASLTEVAPRERVPLALGLINGSAPVGALAGGLAGGWVVSNYGVNALFGVDAVVSLLVALLLTVFYRETFVPKPTPHIAVMLRDALRAVVTSPVASVIFVASFIYNAAFFFSYTYFPVRITEMVGQSQAPAAIGIAQGAAGATTLLGSVLWGGLANRLGHVRLLVALMAASLVLWFPIYLSEDLTSFTIAWAVFSLVNPSVSSLMIAIISLATSAEKRGAILSMIYLPLNISFIVGPLLASFVAREFEVRDVFLGSSVISLLALAFYVANLQRARAREIANERTVT